MANKKTKYQVDLKSLDATKKFAEDLALILKVGDCFCLSGDLGAGKTTLVRAIIRALANNELLEVPSPTFTLVQQYGLRINVGHLDLYRASDPEEIFELGLDDILSDGVAFIEWPELVLEELPANRISFHITEKNDHRKLEITADSEFISRLQRTLKIRDFLDQNDHKEVCRTYLQGDASYRHYERLTQSDSADLILMNAPKVTGSPILKDGKTYFDLAHLAQDIGPFISICEYLQSIGLRSPKLYEFDLEAGFLILEDLGSEKPIDTQNVPIVERYIASVEMLAYLHQQEIPRTLPEGNAPSHQVPLYDSEVMEMEISLLVDWYWEYKSGSPTNSAKTDSYFKIWGKLFELLKSLETSLVLRDFHSPNILWQRGEMGISRVGLIDFQDAQIGPAAYDVASLAQDARISVSAELEQKLVDHYKSCRQQDNQKFDEQNFEFAYKILAAQRACKILGAFVRMNKRDGKPQYLQLIPQIERYLARSLEHSVLVDLRNWFEEAGILKRES